MSKEAMAFRIAFRAEGEMVNAYLAAPETMDGALLLASLRKAALDGTPGAFQQYQTLMRKIVENVSTDLGIRGAEWRVTPAPVHERSAESRKEDPPGSSLRVEVPDEVRETLQEVAGMAGDMLPAGWGFCLLAFTFGEGGITTWMTNAKRSDVVAALQEWMRTEET